MLWGPAARKGGGASSWLDSAMISHLPALKMLLSRYRDDGLQDGGRHRRSSKAGSGWLPIARNRLALYGAKSWHTIG
jgi:hypothetical protein